MTETLNKLDEDPHSEESSPMTSEEVDLVFSDLVDRPISDATFLPKRFYVRADSEDLSSYFSLGNRFVPERLLLQFALSTAVGTRHYAKLQRLIEERELSVEKRSWELPSPFGCAFERKSRDRKKGGRFRAQYFFSHSDDLDDFGFSASVRRILPFIPSLDDMMEMGASPGLKTLGLALATGEIRNGLVLFVAETGGGKSTTMASTLETMNQTFPRNSLNVITIEDPIEYIYQDKRLRFQQIEVGRHVDSWETALLSVLRQDPNVIVIGEIRDAFTAMQAVEAALTGHLVFATMHARNTPSALAKLLRLVQWDFPFVRDALKAIVAQKRVMLFDPQPATHSLVELHQSVTNSQELPDDFLSEAEFEEEEPVIRSILTEVMRVDKNLGLQKLLAPGQGKDGCRFHHEYYQALATVSPTGRVLENTFEQEIIRLIEGQQLTPMAGLALAEEQTVIEQYLAEKERRAQEKTK